MQWSGVGGQAVDSEWSMKNKKCTFNFENFRTFSGQEVNRQWSKVNFQTFSGQAVNY